MPRFAANLTMLFNEVPFLDRFARASRAGFDAVEFLFPYAYSTGELRDRLETNRLQLVLHNLPAGDWEAGDRGIACLPDRIDEFRSGVGAAIEYAHALKVPQVNCLAGKASGVPEHLLHQTFVENLRFAAAELKRAGIKLLIEPINTYDIPGFYLSRVSQAAAILDEVGSDNLYIQYDLYHQQRMEGELIGTLHKHLARIAHVQLADNPGRHEPGTGEIHYGHVFEALDRVGYAGWVGCEYKPATTTEAGLRWLASAKGTTA